MKLLKRAHGTGRRARVIDDLWLSLFIGSFAVYRVSRMLALEDGPFALFSEARGWIFNKFGNGWLNDGVNCPLCVGFYLSLLVSLYMTTIFTMNLFGILFAWFCIAGVSTFLYRVER